MGAAARFYLLLGLALVAVYLAIGGSELIYEGLGTTAWIAILVGIARNKPRRRLGWQLLALSQLLANVADVVYFTGYGGHAPFPSIADPLYQAGALTFGVTLLVLMGGFRSAERAALVDAATLGAAGALFLWAIFFEHGPSGGDVLAQLVSITYPVFVLGLLTILIGVFLAHGTRTVSYYALGAAVVLLVVSDAWYVIPALTNRYAAGTWRDTGWLVSYVLVGFTALHPSMRVFLRRTSDPKPGRRVMVLGATMVLIAIAGLLQQILRNHVDAFVFAPVGIAMALLITVRIVGLVRELELLRAHAEESERRFRMVFEWSP
ncbi:MAG TPA: hypothetical protein VHC01_10225, partial [Gaiellaceae bacterium]|nr:hypothetical protein [Gaiellaceae bacterium]